MSVSEARTCPWRWSGLAARPFQRRLRIHLFLRLFTRQPRLRQVALAPPRTRQSRTAARGAPVGRPSRPDGAWRPSVWVCRRASSSAASCRQPDATTRRRARARPILALDTDPARQSARADAGPAHPPDAPKRDRPHWRRAPAAARQPPLRARCAAPGRSPERFSRTAGAPSPLVEQLVRRAPPPARALAPPPRSSPARPHVRGRPCSRASVRQGRNSVRARLRLASSSAVGFSSRSAALNRSSPSRLAIASSRAERGSASTRSSASCSTKHELRNAAPSSPCNSWPHPIAHRARAVHLLRRLAWPPCHQPRLMADAELARRECPANLQFGIVHRQCERDAGRAPIVGQQGRQRRRAALCDERSAVERK